eukprot:scaffold5522_cov180-Skeletonema_menzelii.AAC.2
MSPLDPSLEPNQGVLFERINCRCPTRLYSRIRNDHTTVTAPLPVCSAKLSTVGPASPLFMKYSNKAALDEMQQVEEQASYERSGGE